MSRTLAVLILCVSMLCSLAHGSQPDPVKHFLASVDRIRSYDVVAVGQAFAYPGVANLQDAANEPVPTSREMWRDAYAEELGRRVERYIDDPHNHSISVKDWNAILRDAKATGTSLCYGTPEQNYFHYYNPNIDGRLLTDWLRQEGVSMRMMESMESATLLAVEVMHRDLQGPVHMWLDTRHGYMPFRIQAYVKKGRLEGLLWKIEVSDFTNIGQDIWVPIKAKQTDVVPLGELAGRSVSAFEVSLLVDRCHWNSKFNENTFLASSVNVVNDMHKGWNTYLPAHQLAVVKAAREAAANIHARHRGPNLMPYLVAAITVLVLVLLIIASFRKLRGRPLFQDMNGCT